MCSFKMVFPLLNVGKGDFYVNILILLYQPESILSNKNADDKEMLTCLNTSGKQSLH